MAEARKSNGGKIVVAVVLLVGGVWFVYARYRSARPDLSAEPQPSALAAPDQAGTSLQGLPIRPDSITPEMRQQFRENIYKELSLTPEQRTQLDEINKRYEAKRKENPADPGSLQYIERLTDMAQVLTPEQRTKAREVMRERFRSALMARLSVLPPEEQQLYLKRFDEVYEQGSRQFEEEMRKRGVDSPFTTPAEGP